MNPRALALSRPTPPLQIAPDLVDQLLTLDRPILHVGEQRDGVKELAKAGHG